TVDNAISGTASLTINGSYGLPRPNSFSGGLTTTAGTLTLSVASAVAAGAVTVNGGVIVQTVDNAITGTASLVVNSDQTLVRANDYSGGTNVSGGTLNANVSGALGSAGLTVSGDTFTPTVL